MDNCFKTFLKVHPNIDHDKDGLLPLNLLRWTLSQVLNNPILSKEILAGETRKERVLSSLLHIYTIYQSFERCGLVLQYLNAILIILFMRSFQDKNFVPRTKIRNAYKAIAAHCLPNFLDFLPHPSKFVFWKLDRILNLFLGLWRTKFLMFHWLDFQSGRMIFWKFWWRITLPKNILKISWTSLWKEQNNVRILMSVFLDYNHL